MSLRGEIAATVHRAYPEGVNGWYIADLLTELLQPTLAQAWDEGYLMALRDVENIAADMNADNPYRDNERKDGED